MLIECLSLVLVARPLPLPAQAAAPARVQPPPGMVRIPGGRTTIGSTVRQIEELGQRDPALLRITSVETPQHELELDDFFLMVNEVTNEQYLAFVRATRHRAPEHWAEGVIDRAQAAYLEEEGKQARAARAAGRRHETARFERSQWWRENGDRFLDEGPHWSMPEEIATLPVVYVDHASAEAYARWAGLRLMTEFEFQRAGRGDGERAYPWGDGFEAARAVTLESGVDAPRPAGSLPEGASSLGVFELSGNVWEWTSSPFLPYPRFRELAVGKGKDARPDAAAVAWDEHARVAVGGSFQNGIAAARLTTRRACDRTQSTDSLGFRCAASPVPGLDLAANVLRRDFPPELRPEGVAFDLREVTATDRWLSQPGTCSAPGYAVIERYDCALFVPAVDLDVASTKQLDEQSLASGPVPFGILALTRDALEPELPAGSYLVCYAAPGSVDGGFPESMDTTRANLVFRSPDGRVVAATAVGDLDFGRLRPPTISVGEGERFEPGEHGTRVVPFDQIVLDVETRVRSAGKGFRYQLPLWFEQGSLGDGWRR